jgi:uncharacterized phage protein gp47/JayE
MQLTLQTFQQLLQRMSASVQSSASQLVDLSVGSMLRAILEANASIGLWVQWLIVQTLGMTRAATSAGADLDSWMADFMLVRQPATAARGLATFTRLLTTLPLVIPAGTQVKASVTGFSFITDTDTTNSAWRASSGGYLLPAGISSIDLPVIAQTAGSSGNVTAGAISLISSSVPGLDFVSNISALSGGCDAEGDVQFRSRFRDYINSRSQATAIAVGYAVTSLQQGLRHKLFENTDSTGSWLPGHFLIVADDGTGQLGGTLSSNIYAAIDQVRPLASSFTIQAPEVLLVNVGVSLAAYNQPVTAALQGMVVSALTSYIEQLPIGPTLSLTRIAEVAYRAGQFGQNIASIQINGAATDLVCSPFTVLEVQSMTVQ